MSIPAYLKFVVLTVLFVLATVNFTRTTLDIIESSKRLDELKTDVSDLESDKIGLEKELEYKRSDEFAEKEARDKLGMAKPDEELFVLDKVLGSATHNPGEDANLLIRSVGNNFRQWAELFF